MIRSEDGVKKSIWLFSEDDCFCVNSKMKRRGSGNHGTSVTDLVSITLDEKRFSCFNQKGLWYRHARVGNLPIYHYETSLLQIKGGRRSVGSSNRFVSLQQCPFGDDKAR